MDTEAMTTFAELLRIYRLRPDAPVHPKRRAFSQSRLALLAGYEPSYVSRLESQQRLPSYETVDRLATVLELTDEERLRLMLAAGYWPRDVDADAFLAWAETA